METQKIISFSSSMMGKIIVDYVSFITEDGYGEKLKPVLFLSCESVEKDKFLFISTVTQRSEEKSNKN